MTGRVQGTACLDSRRRPRRTTAEGVRPFVPRAVMYMHHSVRACRTRTILRSPPPPERPVPSVFLSSQSRQSLHSASRGGQCKPIDTHARTHSHTRTATHTQAIDQLGSIHRRFSRQDRLSRDLPSGRYLLVCAGRAHASLAPPPATGLARRHWHDETEVLRLLYCRQRIVARCARIRGREAGR